MKGAHIIIPIRVLTGYAYVLDCGRCDEYKGGTVNDKKDIPTGWYHRDDGPNGGGLVLCPVCKAEAGKR